MSNRKVLIAGGGIGGIAASIALRNVGFVTRVFESKPNFSELGVSVILSPNGLKSLAALGHGIAESVIERGYAASVHAPLRLCRPDGTLIGERSFGDLEQLYGAPQVPVRRSVLHQILIDAHGSDGLDAASGVVGFLEDDGRVTVHLSSGRVATGGVLVGADGLHSTVRRVLWGAQVPRYSGWSSLRGMACDVTPPAGWEEGLAIVDGHDHVMCARVGEREYYWSAGIETGPGTWPKDPRVAHERLLRRIQGWAVVEDVVRAADPRLLVSREIRDRPPLGAWSSRRVTLLGDAAHPMTNFWGQGANSALEDAVVLARCMERGTDLTSSLVTYDAARVPRTSRLVEMSSNMDGHLGDPREFVRWTYSYDPATVELPPGPGTTSG